MTLRGLDSWIEGDRWCSLHAGQPLPCSMCAAEREEQRRREETPACELCGLPVVNGKDLCGDCLEADSWARDALLEFSGVDPVSDPRKGRRVE